MKQPAAPRPRAPRDADPEPRRPARPTGTGGSPRVPEQREPARTEPARSEPTRTEPARPKSAGEPRAPRTGSTPRTGPTPRAGSARTGATPSTGTTPRTGSTPRTGTSPRSTPTSRTAATPRTPATPRTAGQTIVVGRGTGATSAVSVTGSAPKVAVLSTGMSERHAEQKAMRRHRLIRQVAAWSAAVVVVAAVSWALFASDMLSFDADHLVVKGTGTTVDMEAVVAVVAGQEGTSLALVNISDLREEILQVPNIRDVSIQRQWPSGLAVDIVAREPVAAVPVEGGVALMDQDAVVVDTVPEAPVELPVINIPLTGDDERTLDAALAVLKSLPDDLRAEVASIAAATQDAVTLTLRDGVVIEWGSSQDSALKAQVVRTLRTAEVSRGAAVFDVSAPTFPITR